MTAGGAVDCADELVWEGDIDYAKPLHRALLRDARLSWGARGLFSFLWDLPRGWRPRLAHLVCMSPDGREAVRSRIKELENLKAIRFEPLRGEGGRLCGKRWVLVSPERWAVAAPLASTGFTEDRKTRSSVNPIVGKTDAKVHQAEGSPSQVSTISKTTTNPEAPRTYEIQTEYVNQITEAALWQAKRSGNIIRNIGAWKRALRDRLKASGATDDDVAALDEYHEAQRSAQIRRAAIDDAEQKSTQVAMANAESILVAFDAFDDALKAVLWGKYMRSPAKAIIKSVEKKENNGDPMSRDALLAVSKVRTGFAGELQKYFGEREERELPRANPWSARR